MPEYNDETKRIIQLADQARQDFDEAQKKLDELQSQIEFVKRGISSRRTFSCRSLEI